MRDSNMTWSERLYWRMRALVLPDLENSQVRYAALLRRALDRPSRWLDVGCGHAVFPEWLQRRVPPLDLSRHIAVGLDSDRRSLDEHQLLSLRVVGDGEKLPFGDASFNLVTANMVLEHLSDPEKLFEEVGRVLRPGGRFIVHTPNARGYTTLLTRLVPSGLRRSVAHLLQGRRAEDVYRTYYRANVCSTLRRLAQHGHLRTEQIAFVQTSPQLIAVAPLMVAEMLLIRLLANDRMSGFRACLIASFEKPAAR